MLPWRSLLIYPFWTPAEGSLGTRITVRLPGVYKTGEAHKQLQRALEQRRGGSSDLDVCVVRALLRLGLHHLRADVWEQHAIPMPQLGLQLLQVF